MLDRGAPSGFCFFPVNSCTKLLFQHVHVHFTCPCAFYIAQARTKSAPRAFLGLGARHFSCNFSRKMALVRCPSAFLQRRLAQSVGRGLIMVLEGILFLQSFRKKWLSKWISRGFFLQNSRSNGSCAMSMSISTAQARAKCGSRSYHGLGARHFP